MPEQLSRWRVARAEVTHDWIERRLLPVLDATEGSDDALARRARLCLDTWRAEIEPRLTAIVDLLPCCLLPSILLRKYLAERDLQKIDAFALAEATVSGRPLAALREDLTVLTKEMGQALGELVSKPNQESQRRAVSKLYDLRDALQRVPRSVFLR